MMKSIFILLMSISILFSCSVLAVVNSTAVTHSAANYVQCANGRVGPACPSGQEYIVSGLIFSENFDSQADWYPTGTNCGITTGTGICPDADAPPNWDYYRNVNDDWRPDNGYQDNDYGQRITGDIKRGETGKSWVKSSESNQAQGTSNYYSDSILMKKFNTEYDEIYLEFWILIEDGFVWENDGSNQLKLARIGHLEDMQSGDVFNIGTDGNSGPLYIFDFKNNSTYGWQNSHAPRCAPIADDYLDCGTEQYTNPWTLWDYYDCREGWTCTGWIWSEDGIQRPTFEESVADGEWHKIGLYVKMNSSLDAQDGIYRFYLDDRLEFEETGVPYKLTGSDANSGWNYISIGGNWNNWFSDPVNEQEQWYAIDDIRVCNSELCQ